MKQQFQETVSVTTLSLFPISHSLLFKVLLFSPSDFCCCWVVVVLFHSSFSRFFRFGGTIAIPFQYQYMHTYNIELFKKIYIGNGICPTMMRSH